MSYVNYTTAIAVVVWAKQGPEEPPMSSPTTRVIPGSIYDGDTLRVATMGELHDFDEDRDGEVKVRLCGIDAPELKQEGGEAARDHLRSLLADGEAIVVPIETDRYGRLVAEVYAPVGPDHDKYVNGQMALAGHAWHYEQYSGNCTQPSVIAEAESYARERGLGVWEGEAIAPWEWRKAN